MARARFRVIVDGMCLLHQPYFLVLLLLTGVCVCPVQVLVVRRLLALHEHRTINFVLVGSKTGSNIWNLYL